MITEYTFLGVIFYSSNLIQTFAKKVIHDELEEYIYTKGYVPSLIIGRGARPPAPPLPSKVSQSEYSHAPH
jgi:hypothetical protein